MTFPPATPGSDGVSALASPPGGVDEAPPKTGNAAVDAVVTAVEEARMRPLAEQVAVLERAHDHLRHALDTPAPATPSPAAAAAAQMAAGLATTTESSH